MICRLGVRSVSGELPALNRLGLIRSVKHPFFNEQTRNRWVPTANGILRMIEECGVERTHVLASSFISQQWQNVLSNRLDTLAVCYRFMGAVANVLGEAPEQVILYRKPGIDMAFRLSGDRWLAVVVQHHDFGDRQFSDRLKYISDGVLRLTMLFILTPRVMDIRYAADAARKRLWRSPPLIGAYEHVDDVERDMWVFPQDPSRSASLSQLMPTMSVPADPPAFHETFRRFRMPRDDVGTSPGLPFGLMDLLFIISNWPLTTVSALLSITELTSRYAGDSIRHLIRMELIERRYLGKRWRYFLSDSGISLLAARSRVSVGYARKRWSPQELEDGKVRGTELQKRIDEIMHTDMIHEVVGSFFTHMKQMRENGAFNPPVILGSLPEHKSRKTYVVHGFNRPREISPDFTLHLRAGGREHVILGEIERRAIYPASVARRLDPYITYYSDTRRVIRDYGYFPKVMFVLPEIGVETRYLLTHETSPVGRIPLFITNMEELRKKGPYSDIWLRPRDVGKDRIPFWRYP